MILHSCSEMLYFEGWLTILDKCGAGSRCVILYIFGDHCSLRDIIHHDIVG